VENGTNIEVPPLESIIIMSGILKDVGLCCPFKTDSVLKTESV